MKNKRLIFLITCCLLLLIQAGYLRAQTKQNLDTFDIIISGKYKTQIADAVKISESPEIVDSTKKIKPTKHSIVSKKIDTPFDPKPIPSAKMVGEPLTKLYNSLVKVGMGTYTTPYGEIWVNKLRSKKSSAGVRLKHISSTFTQKGYGYAGYNDDEVSLYGKKFLRKHSLIGNVDYNRNTVHHYGYDTDSFSLSKADTEQRFNLLSANAELKSHYRDKQLLNHDIKIDFYSFSDRWKGVENNVKFFAEVHRELFSGTAKVSAIADYYNYKNSLDTLNNTIVNLNPSWTKKDSSYHFKVGFKTAFDIDSSTKGYIYPDVYFSYNIFENIIIPYAGIDGGLKKNSFRGFANVNPFILSELAMANSHTQYNVFGGLKGTLSATTSYNIKVSQRKTDNMPLFVNDTNGYRNKLGVIYDDASIFTFHGEMGYQLREKFNINLSGDYFSYKMTNELKAWHQPQVKVALRGSYSLRNKIIGKVDIHYLSPQFAKTYVADSTATNNVSVEAKELKGVLDVNIGTEYRYSKRLGFFLTFNNIAAIKYYRWNNYPTQRFHLLGGLSYAF